MLFSKFKFYFLFVFSIYCNTLLQGQNFSTLAIPQNLKENADAVIRNQDLTITLLSIDKMAVKQLTAITVLNPDGDKFVVASETSSNGTKIKLLSLEIYDAFGVSIKRVSKSKFKERSAVLNSTMYSDYKVWYVDYTPTTYPYTVVFESEYLTSSTALMPDWFPISSYNVSVEKSSYRINNPSELEFRFKEYRLQEYGVIKSQDKPFEYTLSNCKAMKYQSHGPSIIDVIPSLMVAPSNFVLKGVKGTATNWQEFGSWMHYHLLKGKTKLTPSTIAKVRDLTRGLNTDYEKAKVLYEYMQSKTRYISVQIGIGGWEPISAQEVDKLGHGDCKALTIYMKALLEAAGVESHYSVIFADNRRDIDATFASIQGNHVILNIPNNGSDLWLECTNQSLPFGYIGSFTDNRNALVISENGGSIKKTTVYKDQLNLQTTEAEIEINSEGKISATLEINSTGLQYNDKYFLESYTDKERNNYYYKSKWFYINGLSIDEAHVYNLKDSICFKENINASIQDYARIDNDEISFKINVFNRNNYIPPRYRNRKMPLEILRGFMDVDESIFTLPKDYSYNTLPNKIALTSDFGNYELSFYKIDAQKFKVIKRLFIKSGFYQKEAYEAYRDFRKQIVKNENLRISFKKNTQ